MTLTIPASAASLATRLQALGYATSTLQLQRIVWGDSDIFHHVNNVHFVRFFESSRMRFVEHVADRLGDEKRKADLIQGRGVSIILAGIDVKYRRPVTYPDSLLIGVKLAQPIAPGSDRFTLQGAAYSLKAWEAYQEQLQQQSTSPSSSKAPREPGPACTADQLCVTYNYDPDVLSKAPIPEDLRVAMTDVAAPDATSRL